MFITYQINVVGLWPELRGTEKTPKNGRHPDVYGTYTYYKTRSICRWFEYVAVSKNDHSPYYERQKNLQSNKRDQF